MGRKKARIRRGGCPKCGLGDLVVSARGSAWSLDCSRHWSDCDYSEPYTRKRPTILEEARELAAQSDGLLTLDQALAKVREQRARTARIRRRLR